MGDARAFLGMYQTLAATGLRATQLDRAPALQTAPGDANAIAQVIGMCSHSQLLLCLHVLDNSQLLARLISQQSTSQILASHHLRHDMLAELINCSLLCRQPGRLQQRQTVCW